MLLSPVFFKKPVLENQKGGGEQSWKTMTCEEGKRPRGHEIEEGGEG